MNTAALGFVIVAGNPFYELIGILLFLFWLWMVVDAIGNDRLGSTERVLWVLIVFFLPVLGSLIYYLLGRKK